MQGEGQVKMKLDSLHQKMQELFVAELAVCIAVGTIPPQMEYATEQLFEQCGSETCDQCASIFCPYGEPLHFHHDGCPCCSMDPMPASRIERAKRRVARWKLLLKRNQSP